LVALNNNDCYTFNWWVLYSRAEIITRMQWFHDTLLAAEQAGERVHVLAHIPGGQGSCFSFWSREYRRVTDRFHMTISATFNGHTHRDEFNLFYDRNTNTHAASVLWNGGAATPWIRLNPNYMLYHVDRELFVSLLMRIYIHNP